MKDRSDTIADLNARLHFCEDLARSHPVDAAARPTHDGVLSGQVIGVKSNIRVAGQAWTAGIGARSAVMSGADAPVVRSLRRAGAAILSRLLMDEGALGAAGDNPHFGRCNNPAFPGHSAGGSSGGSAAAVAASAAHAALGSDTMGSVRIPAAYCGVYGLKLGQGRVPMDGVFPLAPSLDALGILGRTPGAIGQVLDVLAGAPERARPLTRWFVPQPAALEPCAPDIRAFFDACRSALSKILGAPETAPAFEFSRLRADAFLLTEVEAVESLGGEEGLSPPLCRLIDYGRRVDREKLDPCRARLRDAASDLEAVLEPGSVLLLPTVAEPAFAHGARPPAGQADFTVLANIADCPALAIPKPGARPPVSVQLIGPKNSESSILDLARRLSERLARETA